ncbi:hypothetical protein ACJ72_05487, partial [Emergomyces africanus]
LAEAERGFKLELWCDSKFIRGSVFAKKFRAPFQNIHLLHYREIKSIRKLNHHLNLKKPHAETVLIRDAKGKFVGGGLTGIIGLLDNGTVIKSPFPGSEEDDHIRTLP